MQPKRLPHMRNRAVQGSGAPGRDKCKRACVRRMLEQAMHARPCSSGLKLDWHGRVVYHVKQMPQVVNVDRDPAISEGPVLLDELQLPTEPIIRAQKARHAYHRIVNVTQEEHAPPCRKALQGKIHGMLDRIYLEN
jgi:hypothetical protein